MRRYERNGKLYTWDDIVDIVDRQQEHEQLCNRVMQALSIIHLIAGCILLPFVDQSDNWMVPLLLMLWCFGVAIVLQVVRQAGEGEVE